MEFFNTPNKKESPFFNLISEAERIQIEELSNQSPSDPLERSFIVKIRPKATSPEAKTETEMLTNAQLLLANGDYLLARNLFTFLLKKNLKNEAAMEGLGLCFLKLKEILSAKKCFKALWEMHQKSRYAAHLGLCFVAEEDIEASLSVFSQVSDESNLGPELRFEYLKAFGNALMVKNQWDEAEQKYLRALGIYPESTAVLVNLGTLEIQRKRFEHADRYFTKALEIEPRNAKAFCGKGLVCVEKKQLSEALKAFESSLDSEPQNQLALRCLLNLSEFHTQNKEIEVRVNRFFEMDPKNGEIRFQYAKYLVQSNRFAEASAQADQALKILPQDSRVQSLKKILIQNRHWGNA